MLVSNADSLKCGNWARNFVKDFDKKKFCVLNCRHVESLRKLIFLMLFANKKAFLTIWNFINLYYQVILVPSFFICNQNMISLFSERIWIKFDRERVKIHILNVFPYCALFCLPGIHQYPLLSLHYLHISFYLLIVLIFNRKEGDDSSYND